MAKVSIYLDADLEAEVREAGLPVSEICQEALRDALVDANRTSKDTLRRVKVALRVHEKTLTGG